jgi:hypothetical protein
MSGPACLLRGHPVGSARTIPISPSQARTPAPAAALVCALPGLQSINGG